MEAELASEREALQRLLADDFQRRGLSRRHERTVVAVISAAASRSSSAGVVPPAALAYSGGAVEAASMGPLVHCRSVRCMPIQGSWAGVDALPCCAAAAKAEEEAAAVVRSDDVTNAGHCSDFTAVSKLPLVHCLVAASKYDTGSATGCKRQPS